jgi:hypothetical protein
MVSTSWLGCLHGSFIPVWLLFLISSVLICFGCSLARFLLSLHGCIEVFLILNGWLMAGLHG